MERLDPKPVVYDHVLRERRKIPRCDYGKMKEKEKRNT